jgi:hypothetical protein
MTTGKITLQDRTHFSEPCKFSIEAPGIQDCPGLKRALIPMMRQLLGAAEVTGTEKKPGAITVVNVDELQKLCEACDHPSDNCEGTCPFIDHDDNDPLSPYLPNAGRHCGGRDACFAKDAECEPYPDAGERCPIRIRKRMSGSYYNEPPKTVHIIDSCYEDEEEDE